MNERVGPEPTLLRDSRRGSWIALVPTREFARRPPEERLATTVITTARSRDRSTHDRKDEGQDWIWLLLFVWYVALFWTMWYLVSRA
jgi:hypothetical protein